MINANITRDKIEGSLIVHAFIYINSTMGVCMCMHEKEGVKREKDFGSMQRGICL